tara:strand:+ start:1159 stop:1275 length:117 start_codon:yes stop_codon:yes gene_type:complete
MFVVILKKINNLKNKHDLDARFWIQRALLGKKFINNPL